MKGPPDAAIEVLSPDDRPSETRDKVEDYLTHGVPLVVVIDVASRTVTAHRPSVAPATVSADDDVVDMTDVVPDFACTLREIFD